MFYYKSGVVVLEIWVMVLKKMFEIVFDWEMSGCL